MCWLSWYVAAERWSSWWHDDPPKDPILGRQWPPKWANWDPPAPHLQLTHRSTYHLLFPHLTSLPSLLPPIQLRGKDSFTFANIVGGIVQPEKSGNWSLAQWWLPQGLEFLNFPYWLLPGVLTLWSDTPINWRIMSAQGCPQFQSHNWNWKFAELLIISICRVIYCRTNQFTFDQILL